MGPTLVLVLVIEVLTLAGLFYLARYTLIHRSGLNDPEKIQRIWRRARDIRFQPVFRSMPFSLAVGYGWPAALATTVNSIFGLVLPFSMSKAVGILVSVFFLVTSGAVTPLVYRMCGGQQVGLNIIGMALTSMTMTILLFSDLVPRLAERAGNSTSTMWLLTLGGSVIVLVLQLPFIIAGIRFPLPDLGQRIYNPSLLPDWVRLNRAIAIALGPIVISRFFMDTLRHHANMHQYFSRASDLLARLITMMLCSLASIISVNRALLAEDFRWQWRAFLTPAVPMFCYEFLSLVRRYIIGTSTPLTRFGLLLHVTAEAGAWGVAGVYLYLYCAERYTKDQIFEDEEEEEELFGSDIVDEDPTLFEA